MEWLTKLLLVAQLVFISSSVTQSQYCDVEQVKTNKTTITEPLCTDPAHPRLVSVSMSVSVSVRIRLFHLPHRRSQI